MPAAAYRLVSYSTDGDRRPRAGVLLDDRVTDARAVFGPENCSVLDILREWKGRSEQLEGFAGSPNSVPLDSVTLAAPLLYPGAFFCAGANYWDHLHEMAEFAKRTTGKRARTSTKPAEPWFFMKTSAGSIVGDGATCACRLLQAVDWEAEIGVVIGTPDAQHLREGRAQRGRRLSHRQRSFRARPDEAGRQPLRLRLDRTEMFCRRGPDGPLADAGGGRVRPRNLAIRLSVNGVIKQESNTGQMVHSIRRADRLSQPPCHSAAGRRDRDRHAGRRRNAERRIPEGRRRSEDRDRRLGTLTNRMVEDHA